MENTSDLSDGSDREQPERTAEFLDLYSQHFPKLNLYLLALLPTSTDAADVMQETSLVLWRKFDKFELDTNFMAWACKIARIQALKHYQRKKRSAQLFDVVVMEQIADDAEQAALRPTVPLEVLEDCLTRLTETDRSLIRRRYEPGATVRHIATEIGRSANSISKSLGRIRRALLICIERKLPQEW